MRIAFIGISPGIEGIIRRFAELGHEIVVLDDDPKRLDEIRTKLSDIDIATYLGDLRNPSTYVDANIDRADIVVISHTNEDLNFAIAAYAKRLGIPKIVVIVESESSAKLVDAIEVSSNVVIRTKAIEHGLLEAILELKIINLDEERVIALIDISKHIELQALTISDLKDKDIEVLAVIDEEGNMTLPKDEVLLKPGLRLLVVCKLTDLMKLMGLA